MNDVTEIVHKEGEHRMEEPPPSKRARQGSTGAEVDAKTQALIDRVIHGDQLGDERVNAAISRDKKEENKKARRALRAIKKAERRTEADENIKRSEESTSKL